VDDLGVRGRTARAPDDGGLAPLHRRTDHQSFRLADVLDHGLTERQLFAVLTAIAGWKALEIAVLGSPLAALPMAIAAGVGLWRPRWGAGLLALVLLPIILTGAAFGQPAVNHLTWVFWIAFIVASFPNEGQQRLVLRWALSIMYGFAALAKLWPEFLDGSTMATRTWIGPIAPTWILVASSWLTLIVEVLLAIGIWRRERVYLWLAVALHTSFLFFTVTDPWRIGRLVIFGGLSIAVWLRAQERHPKRREVSSRR
jgi:hypothetical protein